MNRHEQVEVALNELRPAMEADGGGVELLSVHEGCVKVRLKGTCLVCPSAELTLRLGVEKSLREKIAWITRVERVP